MTSADKAFAIVVVSITVAWIALMHACEATRQPDLSVPIGYCSRACHGQVESVSAAHCKCR